MRRLAVALATPLMIAATGPRLVPDVSQQKIDIVYSFTGAELLLFGAILYPGGRVPSAPPDVVVVVKGPSQALLVREKGQVAGIWINRDSARYRSVPSFYAVAATRPIRDLVSARTAATYEIGVDNLLLSPASVGTATKQARFQSGLLDLKERSGLFAEHPGAVSIRDGVLYRANVPIPARVPTGAYTAETFLIRDGRVIAAATRIIDIDKSGFERFVAVAAVRWPLLYGLAAVALSLLLGWGAALAFRRR